MSDLFTTDIDTSYLIKKDSNGKVRCVILQRLKERENYYVIKRTTFQYGGKFTNQPDIVITEGKAKRDASAQALLQYNAKLKEYKDKGYKEIEKHPEDYTLTELDSILPKVTTDSNGFSKHMLAKSSDKVKQSSIDKVKYWYASRKIDGVRASFYWDGKKILTASRGGGTYEYSTQHITQNPKFIEFFKKHPNYVLDGELYKHGKQLQEISGAARLEKNATDCNWLEYYIYDILLPDKTFYDRLQILKEVKEELNLEFNPYKEWNNGELQIQMVPQEKVSGYDNIMELHNKYVEEGWEGVVIRNPDKVYGFGKRTNDMIKIKRYKDSEFLVIGYELGLRGIEDMVFICETPAGKSFKAKPMGDKLTKEEYIENFDSKYKGNVATVKYFYYSNGNDEVNGVPLQPCLIAFRDKNDL